MPRTKQPATTSRSKSAQKSSAARSKTPKKSVLFTKDTVVAVPGHDHGTNFRLAKLLQDVKESSGNVRVHYLKRQDHEVVQMIFVEEGSESSISSKDILGEGDVRVYEKKLKKKEPAVTCYELRAPSFKALKKIATNFAQSKAGGKADEEESEEEEEESEDEEEEEEEKKPKGRQTKKAVARKAAPAATTQIEEEEPTVRRSTRTRSAAKTPAEKDEEVTRSTKKQQTEKSAGKKGKATKEEQLDEEEEEEEEEEPKKGKKKGGKASAKDDMEEEKEPEKKKGRKKKGAKEESEDEGEEEEEEPKKGRKKKADGDKKEKKKPTKFKKGKWNPDVTIVETSDMLEDPSNEPIDYLNVKHNNRNLIRAVYTKNYKLLENCFKKDYFLSNLWERWAQHYDYDAFELALKNNDKKAVQLLLKAHSEGKIKFAHELPLGMEKFDTGSQSFQAYNTFVRKVEMGRGGKELTNAYLKDTERHHAFDQTNIERILQLTTDESIIDALRANQPHFENQLFYAIEEAVVCGNIKIAAPLAQKAFKNGGYGLVETHMGALNYTDPKKFPANLRKASCTAKIYGKNITPIHLACINPESRILEHLLSIAPEYTLGDYKMRKPVHYASACEGTGPLKLLIGHSVDCREADRQKNTPLMVACKYGRAHNVELLLTRVGEEKANLIKKNKEGNHAIHLAAEGGHLECIKLLINAGVAIDVPGANRMTPLIIAAAHGHYDLVQWLIENGAKVIKKDKFKRSALILAVLNGQVKIATYLLQNGAEFDQADSSGITAMHYAAAYDFPQFFDILKQAGASQNVSDTQNLTPLTVAMLKNNLLSMKKLLSYPDTDVNCKDNQGRSLVVVAIDTLSKTNFEHIQFLLNDKNADPNVGDAENRTALHYACNLNVENLVESDPRISSESDATKQEQLRQELTEEYTRLQDDTINLLLDKGANLNAADKQGKSPFYSALENKQFRICQILLKHPDLDLTKINEKDEGAYHLLAKVILEKNAIELYKSISEKIKNKNSLESFVDAEGFTPFLRLIQTFANGAQGILDNFFEEAKKNKLEEKQREWDKTHKTATANGADAAATSLRGGARTKQTARRIGGYPFGAQPAAAAEGDDPFDTRPVTLTKKEIDDAYKEAEEKFQGFVDTIIDVCRDLINLGARPEDTVQKLKKFVGDDSKKTRTPHAQQVKLLERIIQIAVQNKKNAKSDDDEEEEDDGGYGYGGRGIGKGPRRRLASKTRAFGGKGLFGGNPFGNPFGFGGHHQQQQQHVAELSQHELKDLHYTIEGHQNALHLIQKFPHPRFVAFLLEFVQQGKIDINHKDHLNRTPLHYFVEQNSQFIGFKTDATITLQALLDAKADVNAADGLDNTPLNLAILNHNYQFVQPLASSGAELNIMNKNGDSPLLICVKEKDIKQTEVLLKAGANPNFVDRLGRTPLHYAVNNSKSSQDASFELEATLLRHGANVNAVDNRGRTALHYAFVTIGKPFEHSHLDPVESVTSLCSQKNCDVNIKDRWGSTPLHYAAQRGAQVSALTLIKKGADVNAVDEDGNTPLAIALHSKHPDIAVMLIQEKANVNAELTVKKKEMGQENKKDEAPKANGNGDQMEVEKSAKLKKDEMQVEDEAEDDAEKPTEEEDENENEEDIEDEEGEEIEIDEEEDPDRFIGGEEGDIEADEGEGDEDEENDEGEDEEGGEDEEIAEVDEDEGDHGEDEEDEEGGYSDDEEDEEGEHIGHHHHHHHGPSNLLDLPEGKYSMFTLAIKRDYQGVAYLLLQHGFDLSRAIQDAISEHKFFYVWTLLSKVKDDAIIKKANSEGQNLYHTFASNGHSAQVHLTKRIHNTFLDKGIDFKAQDKLGRTPLHYAALAGFKFLMEELLSSGADINVQDKEGFTPFSLQLTSGKHDVYNTIQLYINHNADLTLRFKSKVRGEEVEMGPLTYLVSKGYKNLDLIRLLINQGISINEADENGYTPLIHAIRQNSKKLVKFLLQFPDLDKNQKDNDGRTPIHHVVNPMEYASYENTGILELLAPYFDINAKDEQNRAPIYYAYLQDSGAMVAKLKELGATDTKPNANITRGATSVIGNMDWGEEVNYEEDAEKYLEKAEKEQKDAMQEEGEEEVQPDKGCHDKTNRVVLKDPELGYYDAYMTKVDIKQGPYGGYVFYRMQILHNTIRDTYEVYTRYGRIGEHGQAQQTPYPNKETAITEYTKLFQKKTLNEWQDKENFNRVPGKYRLLKFTRRINQKDFLVPFDLKNSKVPKSSLEDPIKRIMKDVSNVPMYRRKMNDYNIDTNAFPLAKLEKPVLFEAQQLLLDITGLIDQIKEDGKKKPEDRDTKKILELQEEIIERSGKFYELIPDTRFVKEPVESLEEPRDVVKKLRMVEDLLDFEVSTKILLGALYRQFETNPLDYSFYSLNVKMMRLPDDHGEYQLIKKYITASKGQVSEDFIQNIFALERRGEAERISKWKHLKNRTLLWHGSSIHNFMGILSQGLRIAPKESGGSVERGLFFADMFTVSEGYCRGSQDYKLLLLCEVALGEIYETKQTEWDVEEISDPYKSVKALGQQGPKLSKKVVLPNGCTVPIGPITNYYKGTNEEQPVLGNSEYIVYDVSQVRIRYLVQTK